MAQGQRANFSDAFGEKAERPSFNWRLFLSTAKMPVRTQHSLDSLHDDVANIFQQLQISTANHQKNVIALSKIQHEVAAVKVLDKQKVRYRGEEAFADEFLQMIMRVLQVKKGNNVADRVIKFIGGYIGFLSKKGTVSD